MFLNALLQTNPSIRDTQQAFSELFLSPGHCAWCCGGCKDAILLKLPYFLHPDPGPILTGQV